MKKSLLSLIFGVFLFLGMLPQAFSDKGSDVFNKSVGAIVFIENVDGSSGTGFFFSNKYILTNYHVVKNRAEGIMATSFNKNEYKDIEVVFQDEKADVAILEIKSEFKDGYLNFSTKKINIGQQAFLIGNPNRLKFTITNGIVGKLETAGEDDVSQIQINAQSYPGSSGSPILDDSGEVIGIFHSSDLDAKDFKFGTSITTIKKLIKKFEDNKSKLASLQNSCLENAKECYKVGQIFYTLGLLEKSNAFFKMSCSEKVGISCRLLAENLFFQQNDFTRGYEFLEKGCELKDKDSCKLRSDLDKDGVKIYSDKKLNFDNFVINFPKEMELFNSRVSYYAKDNELFSILSNYLYDDSYIGRYLTDGKEILLGINVYQNTFPDVVSFNKEEYLNAKNVHKKELENSLIKGGEKNTILSVDVYPEEYPLRVDSRIIMDETTFLKEIKLFLQKDLSLTLRFLSKSSNIDEVGKFADEILASFKLKEGENWLSYRKEESIFGDYTVFFLVFVISFAGISSYFLLGRKKYPFVERRMGDRRSKVRKIFRVKPKKKSE